MEHCRYYEFSGGIFLLLLLLNCITESALKASSENLIHPIRQTRPVYEHMANKNQSELQGAAAKLISLSDEKVIRLLPERSGIFFVKCPVRNCGNAQGQHFTWSPDDPDHITCEFCKTRFPSPDYPENKTVKVTPPSGKTIEYKCYEAQDGLEYYFSAGIELRKAEWFSKTAYKLAQLYNLTGNEKYAARVKLILCGIARNYPDFAWKYDVSYQKVEWENGIPKKLRPAFRTSRWSWWAYMDIPRELVLAYDLVKEKIKEEDRKLIENFFHETCSGVLANEELYSNMSPHVWISLLIVGRVTNKPEYVETAIKRADFFMENSFYFDGFWKEATLSYHSQSSGLIKKLMAFLDGYESPDTGKLFPKLNASLDLLRFMRYPDGRLLPLGDTWMINKAQCPFSGGGSYLLPALGYAMLGDEKTQLHMAFTPKTGHRHFDTLGITLFSRGREMLSDLGYTHTRMRQYGITTPAHNAVSVNHRNQSIEGIGCGKGNIEYMDIDNPLLRIIAVDGKFAQPELGHNRRTAFMVKCGDSDNYYIADFYEMAKGAECYDYFLYGDADRDDVLNAAGTVSAIPYPMLPEKERAQWHPPEHEAWDNLHNPYFAYGYFKDTLLHTFDPSGKFVRMDFSADSSTCSVFIPTANESTIKIISGRAPSYRRAMENNHSVMNFYRNFICLRYENPDKDIAFTNIIHPHDGKPIVQSIERLRPNLLKISLPGRTDYIFVHLYTPVRINDITLSGLYGWVSFDANGKLLHRHQINAETAADILAASGSILKHSPGKDVKRAPFVKIINRASGIAYGYFTKGESERTDETRVEGPLGFEINGNSMLFKSFPQYNLSGKNQIVFFERTVK